jgi:hypothetical protein
VIETDGLAQLIADASQVPLPRTEPRLIDLDAAPPAPVPIRIPDATVTLLEDYELYVG